MVHDHGARMFVLAASTANLTTREQFFDITLSILIVHLHSDAGELYAKKLGNFVEKRLKSERAASVSFLNVHFS